MTGVKRQRESEHRGVRRNSDRVFGIIQRRMSRLLNEFIELQEELILWKEGEHSRNYSDGALRKAWAREDKVELMRLHDSGLGPKDIAEQLNRPINTVRAFISRYKNTGDC
jgi:DNA-binding NarL/FixJ family response regulator